LDKQQFRCPISGKSGAARTKGEWEILVELASSRIAVEHALRTLKRFRILSGIYQNRRKRFGLRLNLIAAIVNLHK